jgi:hypothetical protein
MHPMAARDVIGEKRAPGLGGWPSASHYVLRDGALRHDPDLPQLTMDARCTPARVRSRHRAASTRRPVRSVGLYGVGSSRSRIDEAAPMPRDDGLRLDEVNGRAPAAPRALEPGPQPPVGHREAKTWAAGSIHDGELMSKRDHFQV